MIYLLWNRGAGRRQAPVTTTYTGTPYSHTMFSDAITALSIRLSDLGCVYWTREEMGRRIVQSLRMWQALTASYRERATFQLQPGDVMVDLHTLIPARYGFSVTDQDTIKGIQYSLLEPATGNTWAGSSQFTLDGVSRSLQRCRNQFLAETGIVNSYSTLNVPPQPVGRVPLPAGVMDVRRAAWGDTGTGNVYPMYPNDEFGAAAFLPGWEQEPGTPETYSVAVTPPVSLQLFPAPVDKGTLELITVNSGMAVPDDFTWAVEFGALADLLSTDGLTRDPSRAKYAASIYQLAVEAAKINPSVLSTRINDQVIFAGSVRDLDTFTPDWENIPSTPSFCGLGGRNLLAFGPVPDSIYGVTIDFVPNIPIPVTDEEYVQVGREHLDAILDLAQHLCAFKQGGGEFGDTLPLFQNFLRVAGIQNSRLAASALYSSALNQPALLLEQENPRIEKSQEKVNA